MSSQSPLQTQKKSLQGSSPGARPAPAPTAAAPPSRLKAERVQLEAARVQLSAAAVKERLKAERVQEALKAMPGWRLTAHGFAIDRLRKFPAPSVAASFARYVLDFATWAGQPVGVELAGEHVFITVPARGKGGRRGPLDEAVLHFARELG